MVDLAALRQEYAASGLTEADLDPDPVVMVGRWLAETVEAGLPEPNAMVVSTVSATGQPSSRTVLLKGLDERGLVFFTNYSSRKAEELAGQPDCALLFPWHALGRQVRVEGRAAKVSTEESAEYFATRPRESQLGAWASPQSRVVDDRDTLERRYAEAGARFEGEVPLPPYWGGYRVTPSVVELWQGRTGRMHDRLRYRHSVTAGRWLVERVAP